MAKRGKRYQEAFKTFEREEEYPLREALELVKKTATAKFDETIEMHFRLGIDPRHSDQQVRSTVMLPHGTGKTTRVLVFAEGDDAQIAENAGADIIGNDEVLEKIQKENWLEFDVTVAVPSMMPKVGRVARILGPRGLMPSPKTGTVVQPDVLEETIKELKAGRLEFRNDKTGNLHVPIGKASFDLDQLEENAQTLIDAVNAQKPSGVKGIYLRRLTVTSTMGPGIHISPSG